MFVLRNKFLMPPIKLGYSSDGRVNDRRINFYTARSEDLGAVIIEPLYLDRGLREIPTQLGIDDVDKVEGLSTLVRAIHDKGAKVIARLNHPGRMANPKIEGNYFISSTDRPCENGGAKPERMEEEDFDRVRELFVKAGVRAEKAGFDYIEVQFGHGYLFAQFISPAVNDREDDYGGDFKNRIKFPLEVLSAVMEAVSLPVIARISAEEMVPGGISLDEMVELAKILEQMGVCAIHVTAGSVCSTPPWFFQHMFIPKGRLWELAGKIKKEVGVPVIFVGQVNTFKDIDTLEKEFGADYIAVGRALVADPEFLAKYTGRIRAIPKPCLACSEGCLGGVKSGEGLGCVVNPLVGREDFVVEEAKEKKHFAVVGAGLAGMEAARTLSRRGHRVTLYEKEKEGGQFNLAYLPPGKWNLKRLVDYYVEEIRKSGVEVVRREATEEDLLEGFDSVILATGAVPAVPPIEGLKEYYWAEVLEEDTFTGKNFLVIGGGLIGIEVAQRLVKGGNEVIVVEMLDEIARGMEMIEKVLTLKALRENGAVIYTGTKVTKVEGSKVYLEGAEGEFTLDGIDHIVVSTGMRSYNLLEEPLKSRVPVHTVGGARKVGKAQDAIMDAFELADKL